MVAVLVGDEDTSKVLARRKEIFVIADVVAINQKGA